MKDEWYANTQARINTIAGVSSEVWSSIKYAKEEWFAETEIDGEELVPPSFVYWLENKYGVKLVQLDSGLSTEIEIVDEKKYVLFLLKYA